MTASSSLFSSGSVTFWKPCTDTVGMITALSGTVWFSILRILQRPMSVSGGVHNWSCEVASQVVWLCPISLPTSPNFLFSILVCFANQPNLKGITVFQSWQFIEGDFTSFLLSATFLLRNDNKNRGGHKLLEKAKAEALHLAHACPGLAFTPCEAGRNRSKVNR